jgi:phosphoglycerol transferase MdoB-like AlkP superfamily enzyme
MQDNSQQIPKSPAAERPLSRLRTLLVSRPYSVILLAALAYNLSYKLYWAHRLNLLGQFYRWVPADLIVLLGIEAIFAIVCSRWSKKAVIRLITFAAALICTWSVMNSGWLLRNGQQLLPSNLIPLFRDPINGFSILGGNFKANPMATVILFAPAAVLLAFFFYVMAKPRAANYNRKRFARRIRISLVLVVIAALAYALTGLRKSSGSTATDLRNNCQLRAITSLLGAGRLKRAKMHKPTRVIPSFDQISIAPAQKSDYNIVIIVLEGIQYQLTSLADKDRNLTPFLADLAEQGIQFSNARCVLSHTTKALFGLLTGFTPSVSHDLAEAVPAEKPYASLATILKQSLGYRTAFFQSAKGNFECRPGLAYNLGFDKFWARDDLNDPNAFVGYLACDEFALLKPITEWIQAQSGPFLIAVMCSVTHDPYEVPAWFGEPKKELFDRYIQTISYTDSFLAALDVELAKLNLTDKTILCVVSDHAEAFGEHGQLGHERIAFEETLRVPFVIRAPALIQPGTSVTQPASSLDLTPTLLGLLGFDTDKANFDGRNVFSDNLENRRVYFAGWLEQSPAGFIQAQKKYFYDPVNKSVTLYDLKRDARELVQIPLEEDHEKALEQQITNWRQQSIFKINQQHTGQKILFDRWLCRWTDRVSSAKYQPNHKHPSN